MAKTLGMITAPAAHPATELISTVSAAPDAVANGPGNLLLGIPLAGPGAAPAATTHHAMDSAPSSWPDRRLPGSSSPPERVPRV